MLSKKQLFEIHMIVSVEHEQALLDYIPQLKAEDAALIRPRASYAKSLYGECPNQPMLTFWLYNDNIELVRQKIDGIANLLTSKGIAPTRVKFEALASQSGEFDKNVALIAQGEDGQGYYECHFKAHCPSKEAWKSLADSMVVLGGHLFYNPYKFAHDAEAKDAVVTFRTFESAEALREICSKAVDIVESELKLKIDGDVHYEYTVYDSNPSLDRGWLFKGEDSKFDDWIVSPNEIVVF